MSNYKGYYKPSKKYCGNRNSVIYRSLWELATFRWLDSNPRVKKWSSEEIVIPYLCATDSKMHRYYPDLKIWYDEKILIVEIKPERKTKPPKKRLRKSKKYLLEELSYIKNISKWKYAKEFCEDRNYIFEIWTEKTLKGLGVKIL